jgi:DNA-binding MarR family transcriptional regulator
MVHPPIPADIAGPPMEHVTTLRFSLADVARRLGVTISAISRALRRPATLALFH